LPCFLRSATSSTPRAISPLNLLQQYLGIAGCQEQFGVLFGDLVQRHEVGPQRLIDLRGDRCDLRVGSGLPVSGSLLGRLLRVLDRRQFGGGGLEFLDVADLAFLLREERVDLLLRECLRGLVGRCLCCCRGFRFGWAGVWAWCSSVWSGGSRL